ncbi:MAG: GNAT family N-acetyltransferase [Dehalococcoidia bacterium]
MQFQRFEDRFQDALIKLHRSALTGITHGIKQEDEEHDLRTIEGSYFEPGGEFLIGFEAGRLVAMGGYFPTEHDTAELKRMRVAPDCQGKGSGSALLLTLEASAMARGIRRLTLETAAIRPKTLAFYRKHAYVETGKGSYGSQPTIHFAGTSCLDVDTQTCRPIIGRG